MQLAKLRTYSILLYSLFVFVACNKTDINLTSDVAQLKNDISTLKKTTDSLNNALANTNLALVQTNNNVLTIQKSIDSVRTQLTGISAQIQLLNTQLTGVNANIAYISSQLATLNQQYADLLTRLNSLTTQLLATPTSLSNGLVAYYPFTGNAIDSSGNGNNGTVNSVTLTTDRNGNSNSAYLFAGNQNSYIDCGNSLSLRSVKDSLSISMWFKITGTGTMAPRLISFGGPSGSGAYAINIEPISGTSYKLIAGYNRTPANITTIEMNTWYHLVFSVGKNQNSLYLNGISINVVNGSATTLDFPTTSSANLNIGRMNHSAYDAFAGIIDDVRIYNRVLTNAEIDYLSKH